MCNSEVFFFGLSMRGFILDWQSFSKPKFLPGLVFVWMLNSSFFFLFFVLFKALHIVLAILNLVLALLDILSCFGNTKLVVVCYGSVFLACDIHGQYNNKSWQY